MISEITNNKTLNLSNIHSSVVVSKNDESFNYYKELSLIQNDLLCGELSTTAKIEDNHDYLVLCQDTIDSLPKLPDIKQNKPIIPEFDEIEIEKTDSVEIKKFIRKANYEFIGYHCQHKTMDKECDLLNTHIATLYNSPEFKEYQQFIKNISSIVWNIRKRDKVNKKWKEYEFLPTQHQINKIIDYLVKLAGKINEYNARMNPTCSKCKAAQRKYNYVLKEIQRMRQELIEVEDMKNSPVNNKNKPISVSDFINERFDGIDRFKLSEVKESYKKLYGITKTLSELKQDIENVGGYKITNCQRTYWVSKL